MFKAVTVLEFLILIMETLLLEDKFEVIGVIAVAVIALITFVCCHMVLRTKRIMDSLREESEQVSQPLHRMFQIIAILFMVVGLWRTNWK